MISAFLLLVRFYHIPSIESISQDMLILNDATSPKLKGILRDLRLCGERRSRPVLLESKMKFGGNRAL